MVSKLSSGSRTVSICLKKTAAKHYFPGVGVEIFDHPLGGGGGVPARGGGPGGHLGGVDFFHRGGPNFSKNHSLEHLSDDLESFFKYLFTHLNYLHSSVKGFSLGSAPSKVMFFFEALGHPFPICGGLKLGFWVF